MEKAKKKQKSFKKTFNKWIPLMGLSLALAIIIIDGTVMNVSIKYIIEDLSISLQTIQTIMTTYTLIVAALTITGGRLGDIFGYKKMFSLGASIFGIGSLIASFSPNGTILMLGWSILEGIGAALMTPATTSLIISTYKGQDRNLAFALWGVTAGASAAFGPILGGFLTTNYSWRWAFRINIVIVITLLIVSFVFIKEFKNRLKNKFIDIVGIILSSSGLSFITYGIIKSSDWGWIKAKPAMKLYDFKIFSTIPSPVIFMLILGLIFIFIFVYWENFVKSKNKLPLVNFNIFKDKVFFSGIITNAVITLGQAGIIFAVPIFYQTVLGLSAFETGVGLLPLSLTVMISAPISMRLAKKIAPKRVIQVGIIFSMLGGVILYHTIATDITRVDFVPGLIVFAFGLGLVSAQITNLAMTNIKAGQAGEASGINSTIRQVGQTFGYAIIGAIFISAMQINLIKSIKEMSSLPQFAKDAIIATIYEDPSSLQFNGNKQFMKLLTQNNNGNLKQAKKPDFKQIIQIQSEMTYAVNHATITGAKKALIYTEIFYLLTLIVSSILLPNGNIKIKNKLHKKMS